MSASTNLQLPLAHELHEPPTHLTKSNPILILHGLFGSKKNYRGISKVLARDLKRPVYAIDLRNHGDSPHHSHHDYLSMARDVEGFISTHDLERPTIIGHSMGAKTAMVLALISPSLVHDIVSVDNAPVSNNFQDDFKSNFSRYIQGMKTVEEQSVQKQSEADSVLQPFVESLPVRQFLLGNFYQTETGALRSKIPLDILNESLGKLRDFPFQNLELKRFYKPALFIRGTKSTFVKDEFLPEIEKKFPRYKLVDIEAGHWLISEKPEEFRRSVVDFLNKRKTLN